MTKDITIPKKKWYQRKTGKILIGTLAFIVVVSALTGGSTENDPSMSNTNKTEVPKQAEPTPPPVVRQPTTPLSKLWEVVDNEIKTRNGVDVKLDSGIATIIYSSDNYWDDKNTVGKSYSNFVKTGKSVFKIPEVTSYIYQADTTFTDPYGKSKQNTAVSITMSKDSFDKFNWDNLKGRPIHTQLREEGVLYMHPSFVQNVDLNEVSLLF